MITETDIVNIALARLSIEPIASLAGDGVAKQVRPVWPVVFRTFLTEHEWSFAAKFDNPARLALPVNDGLPYRYGYALPEDCLKLRNVTVPGRWRWFGMARRERFSVEYEVMRYGDSRKQAVFTEWEAVRLEYTSDRANLDDFSPEAVDALSYKLAIEITLNAQKATQRAQELIQRYTVALDLAKRNDAKTTDARRLGGYDYSDARNN